MHQTYYHLEDIRWLIMDVPYMLVGRLPFLQKMDAAGKAYGRALSMYPEVLCEPLEHHYLSLRGLAALDENLFKDLILEFSWREVIWAAWLAALSPRPEYRQYLVQRRPSVPHQQYDIDLALAALGEACPPAMKEPLALVKRIAASLEPLPKRPIHLRRSPSESEREEMEVARGEIRAAYKAGGLENARMCMANSAWADYLRDHKSWRKGLTPS